MYILLVYERELSKNNYLKNTTKNKNYLIIIIIIIIIIIDI